MTKRFESVSRVYSNFVFIILNVLSSVAPLFTAGYYYGEYGHSFFLGSFTKIQALHVANPSQSL